MGAYGRKLGSLLPCFANGKKGMFTLGRCHKLVFLLQLVGALPPTGKLCQMRDFFLEPKCLFCEAVSVLMVFAK